MVPCTVKCMYVWQCYLQDTVHKACVPQVAEATQSRSRTTFALVAIWVKTCWPAISAMLFNDI